MIERHEFLDRSDLTRPFDRDRMKIGLLAEADYGGAQAVGLAQEDEGHVAEIGKPHPLPLLERMTSGCNQEEFLVKQPLVVEVAGFERLGEDGEIDFPVAEPHQHPVGGLLVHDHPCPRKARLKLLEQWRQIIGGDRGNGRHPNPARGTVVDEPLPEVIGQEQNLSSRAEHRRTSFGEHQPPGLPLKERLTELLFQPGDCSTDRRLREAAGQGCASHAAQFSHPHKMLELIEFHRNRLRNGPGKTARSPCIQRMNHMPLMHWAQGRCVGIVTAVLGRAGVLGHPLQTTAEVVMQAWCSSGNVRNVPGVLVAVILGIAAASPARGDQANSAAVEKVLLGDPSLTAGVPGSGPITLEQVDAWLANSKNHAVLEPELPLGLSQGAGQIQGIAENPLTRAKIELGRQLYFDPRLSANSTVSCATCHDPAMGYTALTKTGVGIDDQKGNRNSPVAFNRILSGKQFWDGRADSLEAQAVGPIANPIEMGFTHDGVVKRLAEIPVYVRQFEKIFGELTIDRVGQAIASFERVIVTAPSPYDYYEQLLPFTRMDEEDIADDEDLAKLFAEAKAVAEANPLNDAAKRGHELFFGKANCTACHVGANLADEKYHNLGVGMDQPDPDLGRFMITKDPVDTGAFKTPTVRNAALTAPYMHDGSQATLEEVVEWYDRGGHPNANLSDKIKPLKLSAQEKADLVEFMQACTSPTPPVETGRLPAGVE